MHERQSANLFVAGDSKTPLKLPATGTDQCAAASRRDAGRFGNLEVQYAGTFQQLIDP